MIKMTKPITLRVSDKGDFKKTFRFLKAMKEKRFLRNIDKYGQMGVDALAANTPRDTGLTANSWTYDITDDGEHLIITWSNTNVQKGYFNVALMLQYGHGTRNGGWVQGVDYINPALKPVFDKIANAVWMEVKQS